MITENIGWKWRYETLLCSFLLLIFGNTFCPESLLAASVFITQNMLVGLIVFYHNRSLRLLIGGLTIAHLLLGTGFSEFAYLGNFALKHFVYQLYFWTVAILVFNKLFTVKQVSKEMIAAVLCGFIILCLIAMYIFLQIELFHKGSFSHLPGGHKNLNELSYFSFVTMLTIGYGDITPLTLVAKRAAMLMGLTGHFYTVFVTSIIIGRYVSSTKKQTNGLASFVEEGTNFEKIPSSSN